MKYGKGVYLEISGASGFGSHGKSHSYLVYRDGKGGARVIRGGPELGMKAQDGIDIEIQADIPLQVSKDAYEKNETPESRRSVKLDLGDRSPEDVWKIMVDSSKSIEDREIEYKLTSQNSSLEHQVELIVVIWLTHGGLKRPLFYCLRTRRKIMEAGMNFGTKSSGNICRILSE
ncbi:MAG: hypothetical protein HOK06_07510 [Rhodospirillaceae bacterium]|jgi:hypothetical protein|nr:hypothetical protein [Rhodospirillaceae bacterium]MBT4219959.1 hypothetical protein [Rhodospirillaceae bacterium]MBT4464557.1 hypothetical protein [Rhodospirillaceae bacterium]MBT5308795.1 hypothetical protein [Rhodospirillaceae bacterium]MBT6407434.1 hypothetical protein [Rhodospirillaceae bacterium]